MNDTNYWESWRNANNPFNPIVTRYKAAKRPLPFDLASDRDNWNNGATAVINHVDELACKGELSDGYHTFNELYDYRMIYNALVINQFASQGLYNCHKSKRHSDGEECFGGDWFIVTMELPTGQVSNHYEMKYWDKFKCEERETADPWDGHTPQVAFERMMAFADL